MSDLKLKLWQIDRQLISSEFLVNADPSLDNLMLDDELRRLIYKALKPVLYKRARASMQLPLPSISDSSDTIDFSFPGSDPGNSVELTSDPLKPDNKELPKRKKS